MYCIYHINGIFSLDDTGKTRIIVFNKNYSNQILQGKQNWSLFVKVLVVGSSNFKTMWFYTV